MMRLSVKACFLGWGRYISWYCHVEVHRILYSHDMELHTMHIHSIRFHIRTYLDLVFTTDVSPSWKHVMTLSSSSNVIKHMPFFGLVIIMPKVHSRGDASETAGTRSGSNAYWYWACEKDWATVWYEAISSFTSTNQHNVNVLLKEGEISIRSLVQFFHVGNRKRFRMIFCIMQEKKKGYYRRSARVCSLLFTDNWSILRGIMKPIQSIPSA